MLVRRRTVVLATVVAVVAAGALASAGPATAATLPTVTKLLPTSGKTAAGTVVTVTGTNFTGVTGVKFGTTAGTAITVASSTSLKVTAPAHAAGVVDLVVTTSAGTSAVVAADKYTYVPLTTVTKLSSTSGKTAGGAVVTVTGTNFSHITGVKFGTTAGTAITVASTTSLKVTAPAHAAGTVDVRVTNAGGTSAAVTADHYTYVAPPTVSAVSPVTGTTVGTTRVTLAGTSFTKVTSVKFGSVAGTSIAVASATSLAVTAPPHTAGLVDIRVTTSYGTSTAVTADDYTYIEAPIISVQVTSATLTTLALAWTNPATPDYAGVMIRRATGTTPPSAPTAGTLVSDAVTPITSFTDSGLAPGTTYSYALFAHDHTPTYAAAASISAPTDGGRIAGLVTDSASHPLSGVSVIITTDDGTAYTGSTSSDGSYSIGVPGGTMSVCFTAHSAQGGQADTTGYLAACFDSVGFDQDPTPVDVPDGTTVGGINAALVDAGAISGVVTDAAAHPLAHVTVNVSASNGDLITVATATNGAYTARGIAPGTATVCFASLGATGGSADGTGYIDQCFNDAAPSDTPTDVTVTTDATTAGISAALSSAGAVSGTVTDATSHALTGVGVTVTAADGSVSYAVTAANGAYRVNQIVPGATTVCFSAQGASGGASDTLGYLDACYNGVAPGGTPTTVTVTGGAIATAINATLAIGGAITGTITVGAGESVADVEIDVTSDADGSPVASISPGTATYVVAGLPSGTYDVCFTDLADGASSCYQNATDPSGATPVSVTAGSTTTQVNGGLTPPPDARAFQARRTS